MRHGNWLSFAVVCAGTVVTIGSGSLLAQQSDGAKSQEDTVRKTVLTRFDENRNDKLDAGEAKQARARLRNLLEDKSSREINIMTWREDVHDLLRRFDQDGDNRLTPEERDAGARLLEKIIPKVESDKSDVSWSAPSTSKSKSESSGFTEAQRNQRARRGAGRGGVYSMGMGSGGFANGMGYTAGANGMPFTGYGNTFAGVGSTNNLYNSSMNGAYGSSSNLMSGMSGTSQTGTNTMSGSTSGSGSSATSGSSGFQQAAGQSSFGMGPLTDSSSRGGLPGPAAGAGAFPGSSAVNGSGSAQPNSMLPDGLAAPGAGLSRPAGSGLTGPVQIPPNPRPNF